MVIMVLLNVEFTWATPDEMFYARDGERAWLPGHDSPFNRSLHRRNSSGYTGPQTRTSIKPNRRTGRPDGTYVPSKLLLLACDCLRRTLTGACVGVRALAANRQRTTMTQTAVAAQVHQALDIHRNFTTQVTFDLVVSIDCFADLKDFSIRQVG